MTHDTIAHRILKGKETDVEIDSLQKDHLIIIKPGETVPVDGVITEGTTRVSEEKLRGEKRLIDKLPSSLIYAGSVNADGRIVVRVTATGSDTWHAKLATAVNTAAGTPSASEKRAKRTAAVAPLIALVLAIITAIVWYPAGLIASIIAFCSVLIATAPFIFLAKTQGVYARAIKGLLASGALVKDIATLEKLKTVRTIIFDRTGVLTAASLTVEHVVSFRPYTQQQVLNLAATLEQQSKHPLATTIVSFAKRFGAAAFQKVDDFTEEKSGGVHGKVNGKVVSIGGADYMHKRKITLPPEALTHKEEGKTVLYVASEKTVMGYIALSDALREDTSVLKALKENYRLVLLTGDHHETAVAIAAKAGMHETIPASKAERPAAIARLKESGVVCHVTREATSEADITITLGKTFADVTLLRTDVALVKDVLDAGRTCDQLIHRRFLLASAYHVIMLPLAAVLPLWTGAWSIAISGVVMIGVTLLFYKT